MPTASSTRTDAPSLVERNRAVHRMLVDGVTVEYRRKDGSIAGAQARVIDFDDARQQRLAGRQPVHRGRGAAHAPAGRGAVRQRAAAGGDRTQEPGRRERRRSGSAFQQLQTYQAQIPALFATNAALVVSDGVQARIGALGAGKEWFKPWRTITGREDAPPQLAELQVVLEGVFEKRRFLDLLRYFIVFEDRGRRQSSSRRWPATTSSTR